MSNKNKEQICKGLENIIYIISKQIENDLRQCKNIDLCLRAYNYWQDEECSGINYVFNVDDNNDLKYLVDNGMITASGISWIMKQKSHVFTFDGKTDAGIKIVPTNELIEKLIVYAPTYMAYAIMYVGRCGEDSPYADIYEEYVTSYIEDYFN